MSRHLIISNSNDLLRVDPADLVAIRAEGNYSHVVLADGEERVVTNQLGSLAELITQQLGTEAQAFIRVGRSVIINQHYIFAISLTLQQLTLRSPMGHKCTMKASRDSLVQLKKYVENNL